MALSNNEILYSAAIAANRFERTQITDVAFTIVRPDEIIGGDTIDIAAEVIGNYKIFRKLTAGNMPIYLMTAGVPVSEIAFIAMTAFMDTNYFKYYYSETGYEEFTCTTVKLDTYPNWAYGLYVDGVQEMISSQHQYITYGYND